MKTASLLCLFSLLLFSPVLISGTTNTLNASDRRVASPFNEYSTYESAVLYDSLQLHGFGLDESAFQYAWKGYLTLVEQGKVENPDIISICDFSQSSKNKRLYIISLEKMKVIKHTYVAHGRNSGAEFAKNFSNTPESHKSSLGFYVTDETYFGQHGLSLRIKGVEKGINDRAFARRIVIHGSDYVGESFLAKNPFTGRSYGCPAVSLQERDEIIDLIKGGSCLFIYHPSNNYLNKSMILNG